MANEIFISYRRLDNRPLKPEGKGLVQALHDTLAVKFENEGDRGIDLWHDVLKIDRSDQHEELLKEALKSAQFLLVVCSRNWLREPPKGRHWCRWELETFVEHRRELGETDLTIKNRIIAVWKHEIEREERPKWLTGQAGFKLYEKIQEQEIPFFDIDLGEASGDGKKWYALVGSLALELLKKAAELGPPAKEKAAVEKAAAELGLPATEKAVVEKVAANLGSPAKEKAVVEEAASQLEEVSWNGRTVYVAYSGSDMRKDRERVVTELSRRGYKVLPLGEVAPPEEDKLLEAVTNDLSKSEVSVHLLGEKRGFRPEPSADRHAGGEKGGGAARDHDGHVGTISKIQLEAARRRGDDPKPEDAFPFHRIIWAPKILAAAMENAAPRNPAEVLRRHLEFELIPEAEKEGAEADIDVLIGDTLSRFIEDLVDRLQSLPSLREPEYARIEGAEVYLDHQDDDVDAALLVAKKLQGLVDIVWRPLEGAAQDRIQYRRSCLKSCSGIVVCWGEKGSDTWVKAQMDELRQWQTFERTEPFRCRVVVALPPECKSKEIYIKFPRSGTVDAVINAMVPDSLTSASLEPLLKRLAGTGA